ncbi:hypothetical protein [Mycobacterium sp. 94-17]|uniref:hypothetical protein n=1 Tax=Mycobacterium sp. 94-17 TaxID=2986147 RepID=UPI002D1EED05|nr:hypothetical protein [Mycobacterium sp. 94-17]MEB4212221.1 hypothetical protein [Mycobacterium sp. 94-17]
MNHGTAGRRGVVIVIAEHGDALTAWLRRGHVNAAVVPDRTVARAGRDVAALCGWASELLGERS